MGNKSGNKSGIVLGIVLATIVLVAAIGGASADTAITDCQEITVPGEYYLASDITDTAANDVCIYIKTDDVILDGRGHYIDGVAPGSCQELSDFTGMVSGFARAGIATKGNTNVTIKDVEVKNFCNGILVYGSNDIERHITVEDCTVHDNGNTSVTSATGEFHGIIFFQKVYNSTIDDCVVYNQAGGLSGGCDDNGAGIVLKKFCRYDDITNNEVYQNALAGIYAKKGGGDCFNYFADNRVYGNGQENPSVTFFGGGIRFQCKSVDDSTLENNTVTDNFGPGIFIGGNDCILIENTVLRNKDADSAQPNARGDGLRNDRQASGGGQRTQLYDNTFCENEHLDINVESAAQGVTGDDNRCDTGANYNDASAVLPNVCVYQCEEEHPITDCTVITEAGEYYIANNINNSTADVCIYIQADDVILDGREHYINGVAPGSCQALPYFPGMVSGFARAGIAVKQKSNVTIKDVEVKNFCNGILVYGSSPNNRDITVDNCRVHDNGDPDVNCSVGEFHGIVFYQNIYNSTINNCKVFNQAGGLKGSCDDNGAGIILKKFCRYDDVTGNEVYHNALAGIHSKKGGGDCYDYFADNIVYENGQENPGVAYVGGGIRFQCKSSDDMILVNNTVTDNFGPGIFIGGKDCILRENTVLRNKDSDSTQPNARGDGLRNDRAADGGGMRTQLYDNEFCNNSHLDISVESVAQNVVGDNNTCDSGENYNDASATPPNVCTYQCSVQEQPDLVIEDIRPIRWCCYCIKPSRSLKGGDDDEGLSVMFIDDPELAKEFSDEELRKEVAEALAKDPKLAEEVAAKLAGDDKAAAKELSRDPKQLAELCCYRSNVVRELADLLDTELSAEHQHEMSDQLDMMVGGGCCGGCCCNCLTTDCKCCCCGRFIAYKIANVGEERAGWSLSNLTVNGRVRSVDIVRPLDAGQSRWEVFPCYRMWWWPYWPREVTVCADVTDWIAESDETNNCRTEWWPGLTPGLTPIATRHP